ncbi:MAG: DUF1295 domain-containing protein [Chloroflexota bacterium]
MSEANRRSLMIFPVLVLIGLGIAWAGSQGGATIGNIPLFMLAVAIIFIIQWVAFIPAFQQQSEKFFDLTGSLTYISVTILLFLLSPNRDARSFLLTAMIVIWAVRLGTFLYRRVQAEGKDGRFDNLKPHFFRFLNVWTIQALWVTFTGAAAYIALTTANQKPLGVVAIIGVLVWLAGFAIEVIADNQKSAFRADSKNKGKFIDTGLWSRSRHPNYFGEIMLWAGVAIVALPVFQGWQWIGLISPFFVVLLLTRVSGIPLLEDRADKKWGGQQDYEAYKEQTPVLVPRLTGTNK